MGGQRLRVYLRRIHLILPSFQPNATSDRSQMLFMRVNMSQPPIGQLTEASDGMAVMCCVAYKLHPRVQYLLVLIHAALMAMTT